MKKLIFLLLLITLASCGALKRVVNKTQDKTTQKSDSTAKVSTVATQTLSEVSTKTTITEFTVPVNTPTAHVTSTVDLSLPIGDTIRGGDAHVDIKQYKDSKTGKLVTDVIVKPVPVNVLGRTVVVEETRKNASIVTKTDSEVHVKKQEVTKHTKVEKSLDKESAVNWTVIWLFLIILIIVLLIYLYNKYLKKYFLVK